MALSSARALVPQLQASLMPALARFATTASTQRPASQSAAAASVQPGTNMGSQGTAKTPSQQQGGQNASPGQDTYVYLPPGCSLKEPVYISLGDPVYFYDPPARKE